MADIRTFLSFTGLTKYDEQIKLLIANADLAAIATANGYTDAEVKKVQDAVDLINNVDSGVLANAKSYTDQEVAAAVAEIEALIGALPEGTTAKNVIEYIDLKTANIASDETVNALTDRVTTAEGDIDNLEAKDLELVAEDERLAGLISAEEARAKEEEKKNADAIAAEVERATGIEGGLETRLAAVEADYLKGADKQELANAVNAEKERAMAAEKVNSDAIAVLNGTVTTEGSVAKQVADAVAGILDGAPEAYDTLNEIATWIAAHPESVAAINAEIKANSDAISDLETLVGTLPEGETSANVVAFIQKLVSAEQSRAEGVEAGHNTRLEALESAVGTTGGKTIAEQISEAVSAVQGEVDALEEVVETKADKTTVEGIDGRLGTAEGEIDQLQTDLDAAEEALATKAAQADLEAATGRVGTLEGEMDAVEAAVEKAQTDADQGIADAAAALKAAQDASAHADELNTAMDARVQVVEGKAHEHANETVLNGITAEKVAAWDAAEANAKAHADGLNSAMDGRVTTAEGKVTTLEGEMDAAEGRLDGVEAAIAEFVEITDAEILGLFA